MSATQVKDTIDNIESEVNTLSEMLESGEICPDEFERLSQELTDIDKVLCMFDLKEDKVMAEMLITKILEIYNL